jgi:hypothetical protein
MTGVFDAPKVDLVESSGMVRVTIHPRLHGASGLIALGFDLVLTIVCFGFWRFVPGFGRVGLGVFVAASFLGSLYAFVAEENIEFDSQKLSIRKGFHGWERTREYRISECSNLERRVDEKGWSYLTCKAGRSRIKFGTWLSENDADKVLAALQRTLPDVANRICSTFGTNEHFISLGLGK